MRRDKPCVPFPERFPVFPERLGNAPRGGVSHLPSFPPFRGGIGGETPSRRWETPCKLKNTQGNAWETVGNGSKYAKTRSAAAGRFPAQQVSHG
jgi:hypothetical protein